MDGRIGDVEMDPGAADPEPVMLDDEGMEMIELMNGDNNTSTVQIDSSDDEEELLYQRPVTRSMTI